MIFRQDLREQEKKKSTLSMVTPSYTHRPILQANFDNFGDCFRRISCEGYERTVGNVESVDAPSLVAVKKEFLRSLENMRS